VDHIATILEKASLGMQIIRDRVGSEMKVRYLEREDNYKEAMAVIEEEEDALLQQVRVCLGGACLCVLAHVCACRCVSVRVRVEIWAVVGSGVSVGRAVSVLCVACCECVGCDG
jgi:hypothetical protein